MDDYPDGWFACCIHCGCLQNDRTGHDDTCSHGCNDAELIAQESHKKRKDRNYAR